MFNDQDNELDNKTLTNLDSVSVDIDSNSGNELSNEKYVDDSIGEGRLVRFNQSLQNYLNVSIGNDIYHLTKYDKIQITDTTIIKIPNTRDHLPQNWVFECNDKNSIGKIQNNTKSAKTNSPTGYSGATSLPPIGDSFMYFETSSNIHGNTVFVGFERADIIQSSNIIFYHTRFSILTIDSLKSMGRFNIQLLLEDNTWSTRCKLPKNDRYSYSPARWNKLSLNFTEESYGNKLFYDEIDTAHADMCFSNIAITYSV